MSLDLPKFFFRTRDNGAMVFRVDTENRQRRIELDQIAVVNIRNGDIKPHGGRTLQPDEMAAITKWMEDRIQVIAERDIDDILRSIDHLNSVSQWAQSKATDAQLDAVTDELLLTMHDLRSVLVRKKADRLARTAQAAE